MSKKIKINNDEDQLLFCLKTNCLACNLHKEDYKSCINFKAKTEGRVKK